MAEPIPSPQTLENRIQNEFKSWPKDMIAKLKVEINKTDVGRFTVHIEKSSEEGDEGDTFRARHDTKFEVGVYDTEEQAQDAFLKAQSVIARLG